VSALAIRAAGLSKRFRIGQRPRYKSLRESLQNALAAPFRRGGRAVETIWALRDVSFEVAPGEVIGVIGRNGAGKSTLLKVLARITEPTEGRVELHGRVGSLLEVGTGFHLELTGRENIFLSGAILGMKRAEIVRRFDEIVAFAEIDRFLDTPVKHYSTGMYLRLAFAVAAHLEPEILLVDEVLAVGDVAFQKKCLGKMGEVAVGGRTVLLVSHNMGSIQSLCSKVLMIRNGRIVHCGRPAEVVAAYLRESEGNNWADVDLRTHLGRLPRMRPILQRVRLLNARGEVSRTYLSGERIVVQIRYDASAEREPLAGAGFILWTSAGVRVGGFNTYMAGMPPSRFPSKGMVEFTLSSPPLTPGGYSLSVSLGTHQAILCDKVESAIQFDVSPNDVFGTGYLLTAEDGAVALACQVRFHEGMAEAQS